MSNAAGTCLASHTGPELRKCIPEHDLCVVRGCTVVVPLERPCLSAASHTCHAVDAAADDDVAAADDDADADAGVAFECSVM